jgi:hypothetical protein
VRCLCEACDARICFSCGGSNGGRGELECEVGRELGSEAEAARQAVILAVIMSDSRARSFDTSARDCMHWHVPVPDRSAPILKDQPIKRIHEARQRLSAMPHCLPTSTCLPLLGRLRRHLPGYKSENERYVSCTCYIYQILSKTGSRTTVCITCPFPLPEAHQATGSCESQLRRYARSLAMLLACE